MKLHTIFFWLLLAASGSCQHALAAPPSVSAVDSTLVMPAAVYGATPMGGQVSEADDRCGALDLLYSAVHKRLKTRFKYLPLARDAGPNSARLKLVIVDVFTISARGPTIVQADALLERPGRPAVQYRALRQGHKKWSDTNPNLTECSMIDAVIDALAMDITTWTLTHRFPKSP
ncbi:hypothetical protein J2X66_005891 [Pseudomonas sp. 3296]|uniref:hypothetical protein n=1 Tax=Pseudomonas sp. 3296 TaxID=2817753 RepID=UPI002864FD84|nr:hypothetical protein [Pseudomonas sp. 3296]MDR6918986.1 hypothetical protein [Pseudomonas sp. 3296]